MNSRRTEIVEYEIDDLEELRDEVFSKLSDALIGEKRLLKRFYDFCEEYNNFDFDELGINIDESEDLLRKANKIRDLFLFNIEEKLLYIFDNITTNTSTRMISLDLDTKESSYKVIIEVKSDNFNLELL